MILFFQQDHIVKKTVNDGNREDVIELIEEKLSEERFELITQKHKNQYQKMQFNMALTDKNPRF